AMRTDRPLLVLMMLTAAAEVLGFSHQALLPSLARDVLAIGPEGLGALNAARSVGGVVGLAVASARRRVDGGGAFFVAVLLQIGALASLFGVSVAFGASGVALVLLAGATALLFPRVRRL